MHHLFRTAAIAAALTLVSGATYANDADKADQKAGMEKSGTMDSKVESKIENNKAENTTGSATTGLTPSGDGVFGQDQVTLTAQQEQNIYEAAQAMDAQALPSAVTLAVGLKLPDDFTAGEIPADVKEKIGDRKIEDFHLAMTEQDNAILVDPTTKTVKAVITKEEGSK